MSNLVDFYLSSTGRVSRRQFWLRLILPTLGMLVFAVAAAPPDTAAQLPAICLALAICLVPALHVGAKRLHDIGLTGWVQLIGLIPYVGFLALVLFLGLTPGHTAPNRFGAPPAGTGTTGT